jgi:hypothetical protein
LQFLFDFAAESTFLQNAHVALNQNGNAEALTRVAAQLEEWAEYQESGMGNHKPFDVQFRIEAANEIMEQAQQLLSDRSVVPAAPVVLAGAALEEFLRSMQVDCGQPIVGKPSISAFADALKKADLLTKGDVKDITSWADQRNAAAHGHFEDLSRERTLIMVEGINLFMRRNTDAPGEATY